MLLTIDIGNSTTVFGIFEGKKLKKRWVVRTLRLSGNLSLDKLGTVPASINVIVSSVVPKANKIIKKKFPKAHFVTANNIKGIKVRAKKSEVGADRVVNALAAYKLYGAPAIVVDFGTATTFDIISGKGEYLGGAIAPGLALQADILHKATAKLPKLKIKDTQKIIGKTTRDAMMSGLVYGYVSLVEGMVCRIKSQILNPKQIRNPKSKIKIIATGGFARLIAKHTGIINNVDPDITLKGLKLAQEALNG